MWKKDIKETNTNEIISSLINAAENINSDDDIDWTDCSDYEDYSSEYDYDYDDHNSFELKDPEIIKKWCLYNNDKDFLVDLNNCPKVAPLCIDTTDIEDDIPDDNQFFLDARTILGEIHNKMYPKNINKTSLQLKSDIREAIRYEVLRDRFTVEANKKKSIKEFANDWINHNIKCDQKNALVIAYNKIIQEEQKKKKEYAEKRKKETKSLDEIKQYSLAPNTVKHWIENFLKMPVQKRIEYLNTGKNEFNSFSGGCHNLKMTDDALLCLICMALDFPNMKVKHFKDYLNSQYGPCAKKKCENINSSYCFTFIEIYCQTRSILSSC